MTVPYYYAWGPRFVVPGLPCLDRKGQRCRVLARGKMNSCLIEFQDGYLAITSRNALRRVKQMEKEIIASEPTSPDKIKSLQSRGPGAQ